MKKPAAIASEFVLVTPAMASAWLSLNGDSQRSLSQSTVAKYVSDMRNGLWASESHQGIAFSKEGKLVDGQHRLTALARAEVSLWMKVDRYSGAAPMSAFDVGMKRSPGDALVVSGAVDRGAGRKAAACAAALKKGVDVTSTSPSSAIVGQIHDVHRDGVDFAIHALPMAIASIQAGIAYLYPAAPDEIDAIVKKIRSNVGISQDTGEQHLSLLLRVKGMRSQGDYQAAFYKTLSACEHSFKKKSISRLQAPKEEVLRRHELPSCLVWANKLRAARGLTVGSGA